MTWYSDAKDLRSIPIGKAEVEIRSRILECQICVAIQIGGNYRGLLGLWSDWSSWNGLVDGKGSLPADKHSLGHNCPIHHALAEVLRLLCPENLRATSEAVPMTQGGGEGVDREGHVLQDL